MSWRRATPDDLPRISALLDAALPRAMFARSNLDNFGLEQDHPRSMSFWMNGDDLLGISREGGFFPIASAGADWPALVPHLKGQKISRCLGEAGTARTLLAALGLAAHPAQHDADEPLLHLKVAQMLAPDTTGCTLSPITEPLRSTAIAWRTTYNVNTMSLSPDQAAPTAEAEIGQYISNDSHRILLEDGAPVAMTGFNARTRDMVQIGGVFTPPDLRGRGCARKAVALHLLEAQRDGATQSVLTSANAAATRAYAALGYRQIGYFTFWILAEPVTL